MSARLLILGASEFQVPAIECALNLGVEVFTCDYRPDNPGHRLATGSFDISTTDTDAVLNLARDLQVDGILAYASDPAAMTAAHVAQALDLPGNSCASIRRLTHKPSFRKLLSDNGFFVPRSEVARDGHAAKAQALELGFPLLVKPADSSGSKGVNLVASAADLDASFELALDLSRCGEVVIEQYIQRCGTQIAGDGLVVDGKLVFFCFGDEHFDDHCNPLAPIGESFPSTHSPAQQHEVMQQLQRLFDVAGIGSLVFNLDAAFDQNNRLFLIDLGPRAGGNFIPQVTAMHSGLNLTECAVRLALDWPLARCTPQPTFSGYYATWVVHARTAGTLKRIHVDDQLRSHLIALTIWALPGASTNQFRSSTDALGCAQLKFSTHEEMADMMARMQHLITPEIASP